MLGYIYVGRDDTESFTKIGITNDIERRTKEIRNMNPTFRIIYNAPIDDVKHAEKALHAHFAGKRISGEWFDLSIEDIVFIIDITTDEDIDKTQLKETLRIALCK